MEIIVQDAVSALAAHVGIPLDLRGGSCELLVGDQPFSISHDAALERLVVSALVADATALADRLDAERAGGSDTSVLAPSADGDEPSPAFGAGVFMPV